MEAEARFTWVGVAVLVLIAALVGGILWLKNVGGKGNFNRYAIHFEHQALDGLEVGAGVTLRGIKVGRVEAYALASENVNRVRVEVRVDGSAQLYTNTVAVVTRNFVTGIATITLINGDPPGEALIAIPEGENYPVIGEGRSNLDEIAGRVNEVGEIASIAINNVNQLLSANNREVVMSTIRNLRDLSAGLNKRLGSLDSTLKRVGTSADQLGRSSERIATLAHSSVRRFELTLAESERALAEAQNAFKQIATASNALQQQTLATALRLEDSAEKVEDQLSTAVAELQMSMASTTRVLDRLREPRAALLGPDRSQLGPGERLP